MNAAQLKAKIETLSPGTRAELVDLTGTQDHWQAVIISPAFEGKMMIDQHRMVLDLLDKEIQSNEVHALTMKTYSPSQYERMKK